MDSDPPTDDPDTDTSDLAREVIKELDPGTVIDDKLILSRRQALAIATGGVSASVLLGFATGTAEADAAGQVGTSSDPIDVEANTISFPNLSNDYEIQKDGTDGSGVINFKTQ
jgi:hypothetical protein